MDKVAIIFSTLIHSDDFMYIFWGGLGMLNMFWDSIRLRSEVLSEEKLVEIDRRFRGIKSNYTVFSIFWIFVVLLLPFLTIFRDIDSWTVETYGRRFYPAMVYFFSGYGIYQGLFALSKGVYPMGRALFFQYADEKVIRSVAKEHIIVSLILFVVSVLSFFIVVQF
jgi:hypothetical protein